MNRRSFVKSIAGAVAVSPIALIPSTLFASEAAQPANIDVPSQIEFGVRMGKSGWTRDKGMKITLVNVCNDNRCPIDAQCISQGNAQVVLRFQVGARTKTVTLNTDKGPNTVVIPASTGQVGIPKSYVVRLNALSPLPMAGKKIRASTYTSTLIIETAV